MSKKRGRSKKQPVQVQAVPEEFLAEGSGPIRDIEVISGIQPADMSSGANIDVTSIVDDEIAAESAAADGALATDGEPAAQGDPAATGGRRGRKREGDGGQHAADADDHAAQGDGEPEVGEGDELAARADGEAELSEGDELAVRADGETEVGDGDELAAQGEGEGSEIEVVEGDGDGEGEAAAMPTSAASMDSVQLKQLVEALVFASDKPITVQRLRQLTRVSDVPRLQQTLVDIAADYAERGLVLQQVSGGYQFRTRPQFSAWVQQLIAGRPVRLSRAQLETLAIIAYRQPITRPEIDDIRGVDSSATLKLLMDRLLIRVLGKKEEVGRPMLYGTTREFLDFFSLGDLRELPTLREYSELSDESRKVMSSRLGIGMDGSDGGEGGEGGDGGDGGNDDGGDDNGGGSSGSGGAGGGGGGADDLGDVANLRDRDGGGDIDEMHSQARSLSDLAATVLAREASDDETTMFATDSASDDEATMLAGDDANAPANHAPDDDSNDAVASDDEETLFAHAADDEPVSDDAETRQVRPIIVEDVDLDAETRDIHPVTETMTLADAPDLERSETRIVDPLIAAEVLAHAETIVSSGDSPPE